MQLLIAQALILALAGQAFGAAVPDCHMDRLSSCGDPLAEFRKETGQRFPVSEDQVEQLCEHMRQSSTCSEKFKNECMTPMQLQIMGFLTEGSAEVYKDFCTVGSEIREDYLKNADCLNELAKTDESKALYSYAEASLEDIKEKPYEERLPTACCGYNWLSTESQELGKERCGQDAVDSYHKVVEMAVSSLPSVLCSGFDPKSEECTQMLPPPGTQPKGDIQKSHIGKAFSRHIREVFGSGSACRFCA